MVNTTAAISAFSWYHVPADLKDLLLRAVDTWDEPERAEQYIQQALAHPDSTVDVLISAYRFFFYRQNYAVAQKIAQHVLEQIRLREKLPTPWPQLQPLLRQRRDQPLIRLYLTAYSALGYILARLGELDRAKTMATRLQTIDDNDEFGASLILNILTPSEDDDDD
jgi:tetratricopeptide (TPR) repeat protein